MFLLLLTYYQQRESEQAEMEIDRGTGHRQKEKERHLRRTAVREQDSGLLLVLHPSLIILVPFSPLHRDGAS